MWRRQKKQRTVLSTDERPPKLATRSEPPPLHTAPLEKVEEGNAASTFTAPANESAAASGRARSIINNTTTD